jgi:hypothetical protein
MLSKQDPSMGNKKRKKPLAKAPGQDSIASSMPGYLIDTYKEEEKSLDFNKLREEFAQTLALLEPIRIPTQDEIDEFFVLKSIGQASRYDPFWWFAYNARSPGYCELVEEYNESIRSAGLLPGDQSSEFEYSAVAVVRRSLEEERISTGFVKAWGSLHLIIGRYYSVLQLAEEEESRFRAETRAALKSSIIGQRVWYSRWLLANTADFKKDKDEAINSLLTICVGMAKGKLRLAEPGPWSADWFKKLLDEKHRNLRDRFTRLTETEIRRLANHGRITADILPPLDEAAFPAASHP